MAFPDRRTADVLLTILLFAVVISVLYAARRVLLIFAFAILFSYLIDPAVRFLQRHSLFFKNLRGPHVIEAYLAFVILAAVGVHALAPQFLKQTGKLFREGPELLDNLSSGEIASRIGDRYGWSEAQERRLHEFLAGHREQIRNSVTRVEQSAASAVALFVVVPILAIFFLSDGGRLADSFIQLISTEANHRAIRDAADELNTMLRKYIRAKVILVGCSFLFYSAAMLVLRFPHAIALGILGGVLEFIPVAGWMTTAAAIIGVGFLTHSHWIWMAAVLSLWRMAMDYFISPRIVGQNLEMHPLMVLFAVMVGGEIGGIVGIYLSIPVMVVVRVIWSKCVAANAADSPGLLHESETL
jgi:predicted PurR-regulated permease PerM